MAQSKIEFRFGDIHFVSEGDKTWVTKQFDKIIGKVPSLLNVSGNIAVSSSEKFGGSNRSNKRVIKSSVVPDVESVKRRGISKDLSSFIQAQKAGSNQRAKFLATAAWLTSHGKQSFVTRDVTKAIKEAQLPGLVNPSVNLSQNLKQGFLKKSGKEFVLSQKGKIAFNNR